MLNGTSYTKQLVHITAQTYLPIKVIIFTFRKTSYYDLDKTLSIAVAHQALLQCNVQLLYYRIRPDTVQIFAKAQYSTTKDHSTKLSLLVGMFGSDIILVRKALC